jgi:hypothetical protein
MAYDHKKSNRTITDEQFSDGTTIDGSRLDQGLQDSVDYFNEVPKGAASTRMMQTQHVFGYQPAMYTSMPWTGAYASAYVHPDQTVALFKCSKGNAEGTLAPWLPLQNNKYTTVTSNLATNWSTITEDDLESSTPAEGFQNKWRYKGTAPDEWADGFEGEISNDGKLEDEGWAEYWLNGGAADEPPPPAQRKMTNGYQFVWSHSWNFVKPCILHDLMLYMRTDRTRRQYSGYYGKPLAYEGQGSTSIHSNTVYSCKQLYVSVCVDNPFAQEDRTMNDNEVIIWNRMISSVNTQPANRRAATESPIDTYDDMSPASPDNQEGTGGDGLWGFMYRLRDLNIPIHRNARVRMAIAIPWYGEMTYRSSPGSTSTAEGNILRGWASKYSESTTRMFGKAYWQGTTVGGVAADQPLGIEPMGGMSINGCLTVLEGVEV